MVATTLENIQDNAASYRTIEIANDIRLMSPRSIFLGGLSNETISYPEPIVRFVINGNGHTLDGAFVYVASDSEVTLSNMTLRGYTGENHCLESYGTLTMNHVRVVENYALNEGGGVYIKGGSVVMNHCEVSSNHLGAPSGTEGGGLGAGIYAYKAEIELNFCRVVGNVGGGTGFALSSGGGIYAERTTLILRDTTVAMNHVSDSGGGICAKRDSSVNVSKSIIAGNTAGNRGGGLFIENGIIVVVEDTQVRFNTVTYASVLTDDGSDDTYYLYAETDYSSFSEFNGGGGIYISVTSSVTFKGCYVRSNTCTGSGVGGGFFVETSTISFDTTEISSNFAANGGGFNLGYGNFYATSLSMQSNVPNDFSGDGAINAECVSPCEVGSYGSCSRANGADKCYLGCVCGLCAAGTASNVAAATTTSVCVACGTGQVSVGPGSRACVTCGKGKYATDSSEDTTGGQLSQTLEGAVSCNDCPVGFYADTESTVVCKQCDSIKWSREGSSECTLCAANYFVDPNRDDSQDDSTHCTKCPTRGTSCDADGKYALSNLPIDAEFWRISEASTIVLPCKPLPNACVGGENFTDSGNGYCAMGYQGPLCQICADGYYYNPDEIACTSCNLRKGSDEGLASSITLIVIVVLLAVVIFGTCMYRVVQWSGIRNNKKLNQKRKAVELRFRNTSRALGSLSNKTKSTTSFMQISSNVAFNCNISFPKLFERVLVGFGFVNFDLTPNLGLRCSFNRFDYVDSMFASTLAPIFVCVVIVVLFINAVRNARLINDDLHFMERVSSYGTPADFCKLNLSTVELRFYLVAFAACDRDGSGAISRAEYVDVVRKYLPDLEEEEIDGMANAHGLRGDSELNLHDFLTIAHGTQRLGSVGGDQQDKDPERGNFRELVKKIQGDKTKMAGQSYVNMLLIWTFVIFSATSAIVFFFFKCDTFILPESADGDGEVHYLFRDYSVDCDSKRYQAARIYAIVMLVVFPFGIPATYAVLLQSRKHILCDQSAVDLEESMGSPQIGHIAFLAKSYKPQCYWFEVAECCRRLILSSVIGLVDADSPAAPTLGLILSMAFTQVFNMQPYKDPTDNFLGIMLAYCLAFLFLGALMIKVDATFNNDSDSDQDLFSYILIVLLLAGPTAAFVMLASIVRLIFCPEKADFENPAADTEDEESSDSQTVPVATVPVRHKRDPDAAQRTVSRRGARVQPTETQHDDNDAGAAASAGAGLARAETGREKEARASRVRASSARDVTTIDRMSVESPSHGARRSVGRGGVTLSPLVSPLAAATGDGGKGGEQGTVGSGQRPGHQMLGQQARLPSSRRLPALSPPAPRAPQVAHQPADRDSEECEL